MNVRNLYVPDPQKWAKYYEKTVSGEYNPYANKLKNNLNQVGGSLNMPNRGFIVPIDAHAKNNTHESEPVKLKMISPTEQIVEQARNELKRIDRKRGIKRKQPISKINSSKQRRTVNNTKKPGRTVNNTKKPGRKASRKSTHKSRKTTAKKLIKGRKTTTKKLIKRKRNNIIKSKQKSKTTYSDIFI